VAAIARLVHASPGRVRERIHRFNEMGMARLAPKWLGGRLRRNTTDNEALIVKTATARPESPGEPRSQPIGGSRSAGTTPSQRLRAKLHKTGGVRQFHGCDSVGDDQLFGTVQQKKGADTTLAALKQICARPPDVTAIYAVSDNLSAHAGERAREPRRRAVGHSHLLLVGQPDRVAVRPAAGVREQ
jgi:hypothetical protein